MPKQRLIIDVEYDPIDEEGDACPPAEWVVEHANENLNESFTLVGNGPVVEMPYDEARAKEWHEEQCSEDECVASDEASSKYPCPVVVEPDEGFGNAERDIEIANKAGISLSAYQ